MQLINLMPLLIFHCRIRLSLAFIRQRTLLGGAPAIRLQVQSMNFALISHHAFQYNHLLLKIFFYVNKTSNLAYYVALDFVTHTDIYLLYN